MQTPTNRLGALVAEVRELPAELETPLAAGLLVADTVRAIGYDDDAIVPAVGVDLAALEGGGCWRDRPGSDHPRDGFSDTLRSIGLTEDTLRTVTGCRVPRLERERLGRGAAGGRAGRRRVRWAEPIAVPARR
jgi:hypothetical protein